MRREENDPEEEQLWDSLLPHGSFVFRHRRYSSLAARMRRTEVRLICSRRAIPALLTPARYSFCTGSAFRAAVMGRPNRLPFLASPARTRSRRISCLNPILLQERT
jgi:hypothetical protein